MGRPRDDILVSMNISDDLPIQSRGSLEQIQRARAYYDASPNLCVHCDGPILSRPGEKLSETRKKKFCSRSCAASHNNSLSVAPKKKPRPRYCESCGARVSYDPQSSETRHILCPTCSEKSAQSLVTRTKSQSSPADIRNHMRSVLAERPHQCQQCGYALHAEACHVRPIDDFPPSATLTEINHPDNLVLLCPNCRWEFTHGLVALVPSPANAWQDTQVQGTPAVGTTGTGNDGLAVRRPIQIQATTKKRPTHGVSVASSLRRANGR